MSRHRFNPHRAGFTLVELLTVVVIIGIVAGLGLPFLGRALDGSKVSAGVNAVTVAAQSTRLLATSRSSPIGDAVGSSYSGTALIITPPSVSEMRLTENVQDARNAGDLLEGLINRDGYRDIPSLDSVRIPAGVRILGISRSASDGLRFIQAPFAIRFSENGSLLVGADLPSGGLPNPPNLVDYDGDNDDDFEGSTRPSDYDTVGVNEANNFPFNASAVKQDLPFERYESVPGVRIIQVDNDPENPQDDYADIFFSRLTGTPTVIRNVGNQE